MKKLSVFLLLLLVATAASAIAVDISGTIRDDQTSLGIENSRVRLFRDSAYYTQAYTIANGTYSFQNLPSGTYYIEASHANYLTQTSSSHYMPDSTSINLSLNLLPKLVQATVEVMTINGMNVMINPYNVNIGDTLSYSISIRNTGNVSSNLKLQMWSTGISMEPSLITTNWVSATPNQAIQFNLQFMIDSNYLNGTRDITLKIMAWDPTRTQSTVYPASYVEYDDSFQVTSYFKKVVVSLIDFDKPVYQPLDVANIAVKLQNNGEFGASFNVDYYISDIPQSSTDFNGFLFSASQHNIILQPGEELLLNRLQWTLPLNSDNKGYYLFINVTSQVGDEVVQYDVPIVSFYSAAIPTIVNNITEHYRPVGTLPQIIPVNVDGVDYYVAMYYTQDSAVLYNDGGSSWVGGFNGIEFMTVIDTQGTVIRQQSDTWRKALFTAMANHIMNNGESYWTEVLKQIEKLFIYADENYDNDSAYINNQIDNLTHMRTICKIGSFISGFVASSVGGAAFAGKAVADVSIKQTIFTYVMPWVLNEIAQSTIPDGLDWPPDENLESDYPELDFDYFCDVSSLEEAQIKYDLLLSQGSDNRAIVIIAVFLGFTAIDILCKYFESVYEADLAELNANANLVLPPLQRMKGYLMTNAESGYIVGRIIYDKLQEYKSQKPTYAKICDVLGWGIEDPFGIVFGDLSSVFFNYYTAGITEKIAYLDGVNTIDGNNTFASQISVSQQYFDTLNQMQNRYFMMKGSIYFDSYSLGLLGLEKLNQIDSGNFYQNGYAMTITIPPNTTTSPLPLEATLYFDSTPITSANLVWSITGTNINGNLLHQGNGVYTGEANISSLLGITDPNLYRIDFTATMAGEEITGFTYFHVLPQNDETVYFALPNPYAMNAEELALFNHLEQTYASVVLFSLNDISSNPIDPEDIPVMILFNNTSSIPSQYSNPNFQNNIVAYLQSGGNLTLFGNAAEILDLAGITDAMFSNVGYYINSHAYQRVSNFSHPITYNLPTTINLADGFQVTGSYFSNVDPSMGMTQLGYYYNQPPNLNYDGSNYNNFVEVPFGNGKAVVLGVATFQYATEGIFTLAGRIIYYLQNNTFCTVGVQLDTLVPGIQNATFEIQAEVFAYSGELGIDGVTNTLTLPSDCFLDYVTVDGTAVFTSPAVVIGSLEPNQSKTIVYGIHATNPGVKTFTSNVTTQFTYYNASDQIQKQIHLPGALDVDIALLINDANSQEIQALKAYLEWSGYSVDLLSPSVVVSPGVLDDYNQLILMNNVSTLPLEYSSADFQNILFSYLQSGGNLTLFGNAAEILDLAGITDAMFSNVGYYINSHAYQRVSNFSHPITYNLPTTINLADGFQVTGSYFSNVDPSMGMTQLGYYYNQPPNLNYDGSNYNNFVEVPFGSGKAVVLGVTTFLYASDGMKTLAGRIIDYLQIYSTQELAAPTVTISRNNDNIVLQWDSIPNAQSYNIYTSNADDSNYGLMGSTENTSYTMPIIQDHRFYIVKSSTEPVQARVGN